MSEADPSVRPCYYRPDLGSKSEVVEVIVPLRPDDEFDPNSDNPLAINPALGLTGVALAQLHGNSWTYDSVCRQISSGFELIPQPPIGDEMITSLLHTKVGEGGLALGSFSDEPIRIGDMALGVDRLTLAQILDLLARDQIRMEFTDDREGELPWLLLTPGGAIFDSNRAKIPAQRHQIMDGGLPVLESLIARVPQSDKRPSRYLGTVGISLPERGIFAVVGETARITDPTISTTSDRSATPVLYRGGRTVGIKHPRLVNPGLDRLPSSPSKIGLSLKVYRAAEPLDDPFTIALGANSETLAQLHERGIDRSSQLGFDHPDLAPSLIAGIDDNDFGYVISKDGINRISRSRHLHFQNQRIIESLGNLRTDSVEPQSNQIVDFARQLVSGDEVVMVSRRLPTDEELISIARRGVTLVISPHPDETGLETGQWRKMVHYNEVNNINFITTFGNNGISETRYFDEGLWKRIGDRRRLADRVGIAVFGSSEKEATQDEINCLSSIATTFGDELVLITGAGPKIMDQARAAVEGTGVMTVGIGTRFASLGEASHVDKYDAALKLAESNLRQELLDKLSTIPVIFLGASGTSEGRARWTNAIATRRTIPTPICFIGGDNYLYDIACREAEAQMVRGLGNQMISHLLKRYEVASDFVGEIGRFIDNPIVFWEQLEKEGVFSPEQMSDILGEMTEHYRFASLPLPKIVEEAQIYAQHEAV